MSQRRVFVATPTYGGNVDVIHHASIIKLVHEAAKNGIELEFPFLSQESLVTRARNQLLHDFMCSNCTDLFWIDADIGFDTKDFFKLLQSGFSFVCGAYPKKGLDMNKLQAWVLDHPDRPISEFYDYAYNPLDDNASQAISRNGGLYIEVRHAATGFMLWSRDTASKLIAASKEYPYFVMRGGNLEAQYRVFHTDVAGKDYLSEDYWACDLFTGIGGKVYVDLLTKLSHTGRFTWNGDLNAKYCDSPVVPDAAGGV